MFRVTADLTDIKRKYFASLVIYVFFKTIKNEILPEQKYPNKITFLIRKTFSKSPILLPRASTCLQIRDYTKKTPSKYCFVGEAIFIRNAIKITGCDFLTVIIQIALL